MISSLELRLNNLFRDKYSGQVIKVICIEQEEIHFSGYFPDKWQAEPIPLTEEILLKVGFEKDEGLLRIQFSNCHEISFDTKDGLGFNQEWRGHQIDQWGHIKYLHQLQNIYFALTGQELNTEGL